MFELILWVLFQLDKANCLCRNVVAIHNVNNCNSRSVSTIYILTQKRPFYCLFSFTKGHKKTPNKSGVFLNVLLLILPQVMLKDEQVIFDFITFK